LSSHAATARQVSLPPADRAALSGLKVVEFVQLIAGPLAGTLLADLGADVVRVESPGKGDAARVIGPEKDGVYLWWKVGARNNRSVTLDLRRPEGQAVAHRLVAWADVVIVNLLGSTLERWGLDWKTLHKINKRLIYLQISGSGAQSPSEPGYGKVGEARSGVAYLTGERAGPPVFTGFSHADSVTALMGSFAVTAALHRKQVDPDFAGEWIDLALFESLYRLIEWQIIVYDQTGLPPQRAGNRLEGAPAAVVNTYLTADNDWLIVTSGTVKSVQDIATLLGLPPENYRDAASQRDHRDEIDEALAAWIRSRPTKVCLTAFEKARVVSSPIYSAADIVQDPLFLTRGAVIQVQDYELGDVRMQGVIPKLANHAGTVWRAGPTLGEDNELVFRDWLGMPEDELANLRTEGVV
jgi:crotonobetainyl-CoA:carnitine CoA-transferase CaiB-like acyl-CoA transferase